MIDFLKMELVKHKLKYNLKTNQIYKEIKKLGLLTITNSFYLAKLILPKENINYNYKINDSIFHGNIENENKFINVIFLEFNYNFIGYFNDDLTYLKEASNHLKKYLKENNLETELDRILICKELQNIENLIDYSIKNDKKNINYILYYYPFGEKSLLSNYFKKYINTFINNKYNISFNFSYKSILEALNDINDNDTLEQLEYYDLFKNDLTYEKIFDDIVISNESNIYDVINKYNISKRTADIIWKEYELYNDNNIKFLEIIKVAKKFHNVSILEPESIRQAMLYSSKVLANVISDYFINEVFDLLVSNLNNGYIEREIASLNESIKRENDTIKSLDTKAKMSSLLNEINEIKFKSFENDKKYSLIKKYVSKIYVEDDTLAINIYPLKELIKR